MEVLTYDENPRRRPPKPPKKADGTRSFCKVCGQWPKRTAGGNLAKHDYPAKWREDDPEGRCPGSGRRARIADQPELDLGSLTGGDT